MKKRLFHLLLFLCLSLVGLSRQTDTSGVYPLKYVACISQTGANAPTVNRLYENTLGDYTWIRYDEGVYTIIFNQTSFQKNQIWLYVTFLPDADPYSTESQIGIEWGQYQNSIRINTKGDQGFDDAYIEIRVYEPLNP